MLFKTNLLKRFLKIVDDYTQIIKLYTLHTKRQ